MATRRVLQLGDPGLRQTAIRVDHPAGPEVRALVQDLSDTLAHWRANTGYGRAIAAPQIGANLRVIFLKLPGTEPWPLVNPEITQRSPEKVVVWDACLSFLSIFMQVERHREISVRYQDLSGEWHEIHVGEERNLSELLQHEIDHLHGALYIDRMQSRTFTTLDNWTRLHKGKPIPQSQPDAPKEP